ncbi:MAG: hypothetical protein ACRDZO_09895 [Egibacteraceae bacterium]
MAARRDEARLLLGCAAVLLVVAGGVMWLLGSDTWRRRGPETGLQQLDLFYLDEPAPALDGLGIRPGTPAVIVVCRGCRPPDVGGSGQVVVTGDPETAVAYGLLTTDGQLGPGYAIVDARGRARYRTFDPGVSRHAKEIGILLEAAR